LQETTEKVGSVGVMNVKIFNKIFNN